MARMKNEPEGDSIRSSFDANEMYEEMIIVALQQGEQGALAVLMRRYEGSLFNYLFRLTGSREDAQDLFQDSFVRVFRRAQQYDASRPFKPWLYQIATNLCRDTWRKRGRRHETALLDEDVKTESAGPGEIAAAREQATVLATAVAALPLKQRAVFVMARYQDMPYEQIGAALEIPVGTVKSRMHKAVSTLMKKMEMLQA